MIKLKLKQKDTIVKIDFSELIYNELGISRREAIMAVQVVFDSIAEAVIMREEQFQWDNFGVFYPRKYPPNIRWYVHKKQYLPAKGCIRMHFRTYIPFRKRLNESIAVKNAPKLKLRLLATNPELRKKKRALILKNIYNIVE